jgi:hypothetical protein
LAGTVVRASRLMHGKTSPIRHRNTDVFRGMPPEFRRHALSLALVERGNVSRRARDSPRRPPRARSWASGTGRCRSGACSFTRIDCDRRRDADSENFPELN